ncbi:hypothetical protein AA309_02060 [Microvirga vignae]|uniref:Uncharacterized protein n=1 Tax=Microvirga vignae TaxID=1225564 RepID=A0A0H1RI58_9HYPH|nr:hypothetical protein [Microvirga vignae]KLK94764.1 hypothetical protein AA309_02060 [Microvirga vignae]
MKRVALAALGLILSAQAAFAAEPVFPPASRIGLVPPQDMALSRRFSGFENEERAAVITFAEMPAQAFDQLASGLTKEVLRKQGLDMKSRENVKLGSKNAILVSGTMTRPEMGRKWLLVVKDEAMTGLVVAQVHGGRDGYSDVQIRDALKSVALRRDVSLDEQVSALPFRLGEKAGFRPVRVMAGNSVLFTDGPKDTIKSVEQPIMILAASLQPSPPPGEQRKQFAQAALYSNRVLKDIRIERSESFRLRGQDWHEIVARATEAESGQPIVVMQSIRFDGDRYVRMVGLSREEQRDQNLPRFRAIADGVETNF